jgi:hypothetical protein
VERIGCAGALALHPRVQGLMISRLMLVRSHLLVWRRFGNAGRASVVSLAQFAALQDTLLRKIAS